MRGNDIDQAKQLAMEIEGVPMNVHTFNAYGRAEGQNLPPLQINKVFDEWECYSTDGTCFNQNLIARSKHQLILEQQQN